MRCPRLEKELLDWVDRYTIACRQRDCLKERIENMNYEDIRNMGDLIRWDRDAEVAKLIRAMRETYDKLYPYQGGIEQCASTGGSLKDLHTGKPNITPEQKAVMDYMDKVFEALSAT